MKKTYLSETMPRMWHLLWNGPARTHREEEHALRDIPHLQGALELDIPKQYKRTQEMLRMIASPNSPLQMPHLAFRYLIPELHWHQTTSKNSGTPLQFTAEYHLQRLEPVELFIQADFFAENTRATLIVLFFPEIIENYSHAVQLLLQHLQRPLAVRALTHENGELFYQGSPLHAGQPYSAPRSPQVDVAPARKLMTYWTLSEIPLIRQMPRRGVKSRNPLRPSRPSLVPA